MKKLYLLALFLAITPMLVISVLAQETEDNLIPGWVKGVANFWVEDKINDGEFAEALEFLITEKIINLDNSVKIEEMSEENPLETVLAETPIQIVNMQKIIDDLQIQNDAIEESKDVLEEEFMKKESETQAYYEQEIENMRLIAVKAVDEKNTFKIVYDSMKFELDSVKQELDDLKQK